MMDASEYTIDWGRCVYVDDVIDDALVTRLAPHILSLRQSSNQPITVAINSSGGSLNAADALIGLITGPNQDGETCRSITVVTHHAYSAAANMLALGDYAVALPHTDLLFHDVRYGGLDDVTPDKARIAAKQLQSSNEAFSLRLADNAFRRLMWNYFDVREKIAGDKEVFADTAEKFNTVVQSCNLPLAPSVRFDLTGFAVAMFARLRKQNEGLIEAAMEQLGRWAQIMAMSDAMPRYSTPNTTGLLDGALSIFRNLAPDHTKAFGRPSNEVDMALLLTLASARLATSPMIASATNFERALNEFALIKSINDPKHQRTAARLLSRHKHAFFSSEAAAVLEGDDEEAKSAIRKEAEPVVRLAWLLCVLVCRELFRGEHDLTPVEALCLGLVDEVTGGSFVESPRQFITSGNYEKGVEARKLSKQASNA